ncbi:MAG: alanine racemase [Cytophagales bacterium]|nr:alanine racemase [Cytophagales bacterium]
MADLNHSRPILATIHAGALRHNFARIQAAVAGAGDAKIWAVVKANAYGHGVQHVFEGLRAADGFACLELTEAEVLRHLGWRGPILLLEGAFHARDLEVCSRLNVWHVIHCDAQIDWLAAHKTNEPQRVFLKLNSGMNRLGLKPAQYRAAYARLATLPQVAEVSHFTHFSDADSVTVQGLQTTTRQWEVFQIATQDLDGESSLGNSAASLRSASRSGDWVRAGVALYGSAPDYPAKTSIDWGLQPAMTLSSRMLGVQDLAVGDTVGYGSTFVADRPMRIGIVACGYADGYPRHASTAIGGAPVLVDGVRSRTLGRISMDMLAVDLTHLPSSGWGSLVTLWGRANPQDASSPVLPIDEVAAAAGTISYELMCAVAARVPVRLELEDI